MEYIYKTQKVCARNIKVDVEDNIVTNIQFLNGGCSGNLKALPAILEGWTVEDIENKLSGITCGKRPTSCADQLVKAVKEAYQLASEKKH